MAIETDSYYNVVNGGITLDRIGLSKTLNNYTTDEIKTMTFCAFQNKLYRNVSERYEENLIYFANNVQPLPFNAEAYQTIGNGGKYTLSAGSGSYNQPDGLAVSIVWLSFPYGSSPPRTIRNNTSTLSSIKIITEMDAPKYVFELVNPKQVDGVGATSWSDDNADLYFTGLYSNGGGDCQLKYQIDDETFISVLPTGGPVIPYLFVEINGWFILSELNTDTTQWYNRGNGTASPWDTAGRSGGGGLIPWATSPFMSFGTSLNIVSMSSTYGGANVLPYIWYYSENDWGVSRNFWAVSDDGHPMRVIFGESMWDGTGYQRGFATHNYFNTRDEIYNFFAGGGIKFKTDKIYKPIIQDGWVVGYTDDMSSPSDLDEWHGSTIHTIAPIPPGPGPTPGPYDDDPWSGATFAGTGVGGAGAFAKVYYMTSTELANLRSWMNSINVPEGFNPMQQIIGLSQVPVALSGSGPENVVFVNSSAVYDPGVTTRAVDTGVATQQALGTPISYYLGSVDIVRRMQQRGEPYLDYDCQIELYLPLIGMFSLDTQAVMGRTISAYAVLDPVSGTLAAYAYVTKDGQNLPVAYGSTTIGVDLPISAQQLSVSRAALKQANAQLGASLLSGALTMLAAASSSGKSSGSGAKTSTGSSGLSAAGIREAGSDYMKASQVGNVFGDFMNWGRTIRQLSYGNNTAVAGSFGGSTAQWSYPFTPYVKIIRPRYEKPSNYAHSQGVPCVQTKTVGSCTGFIQCIGVDVSGITGATDLELQAIQAALSNGIYAGGGQ